MLRISNNSIFNCYTSYGKALCISATSKETKIQLQVITNQYNNKSAKNLFIVEKATNLVVYGILVLLDALSTKVDKRRSKGKG
jgi:hypothetical protein